MNKKRVHFTNYGVTFIETIIVVALTSIVLSAVVMSTVTSLKSATFASNKSQATKYGQEGMELARRERDIGWYAFYDKGSEIGTKWCVDKSGSWSESYSCTPNIDNFFSRSILLQWDTSTDRMNVTVIVEWPENGTTRKSTIQSFLTKWR